MLYHAVLFCRTSLMRHRVDSSFTLEHITLCHVLGFLFSAALLPWLVAPVAPEVDPNSAQDQSPGWRQRYRVHRYALGCLLVFLMLACNYPGAVWEYQGANLFRYLKVFTFAMFCPVVYGYFFAATAPARQGLAFGASLFLGAILAGLILRFGDDTEVFTAQLPFFSHLTYGLIILFALVLLLGLLRGGLFSYPRRPLYLADVPKQRRRAIALLFAAALAYNLINELNRVQFFPNTPEIPDGHHYLSVLYVVCPVIGWFLDRFPLTAFRPIIQGAAAVFMLTPVLLVAAPASRAHWGVDVAVYLAMHATNITLVVTLARLLSFGRGYFFALSLLSGVQTVNIAMSGIIRNLFAHDTGILILVCILTVMLFYVLVKSIHLTVWPRSNSKTRVLDYSGLSFIELFNRRSSQGQGVELLAQDPPAGAGEAGGAVAGTEALVGGAGQDGVIGEMEELAAEPVKPEPKRRRVSEDSTVIIENMQKHPRAPALSATDSSTETADETDAGELFDTADSTRVDPKTDTAELAYVPAASAGSGDGTDTSDADEMFAKKELTRRESDTAYLIIKGLTNREIAEIMGISEHTVANHVKQVLRKFGVPSRKSLMAIFIEKGEELMVGYDKTAPLERRSSSRMRERDSSRQDAL